MSDKFSAAEMRDAAWHCDNNADVYERRQRMDGVNPPLDSSSRRHAAILRQAAASEARWEELRNWLIQRKQYGEVLDQMSRLDLESQ